MPKNYISEGGISGKKWGLGRVIFEMGELTEGLKTG